MELKELLQTADWTKEKHVPAIEIKVAPKKGEIVKVKITVGKEIPHPNTTEHHIRWINVYFLPDGEKFPIDLGKFEFNSHGESGQGPNMSTVFTLPEAKVFFKTEKSGTIISSSYCNIHGLWTSTLKLDLE